MSTLHLVLGDHGAGCLREACRAWGLPGNVIAIPDDLSHGPLDDGRKRLDYMRACYRGCYDWNFDEIDGFRPWHALIERLDRERPEDVTVWNGESGSERVMLAMACWWLRDRSEPLMRAGPDPGGDEHYVAAHRPDHLSELFATRRELTQAERAELVDAFLRVRRDDRPIRRWEQGALSCVPIDHYDPQLLSCCERDWLPAGRIVGFAMSRCDPHNRMSDLFFCSRLQALIEQGTVEISGPRERLRDYRVRLRDLPDASLAAPVAG